MRAPTFGRGDRLTSGLLNAISRTATTAHHGSAGFLSQENGREVVPRNPRRPVAVAPRAAAPDVAVAPAIVTAVHGGVYVVDVYANGLTHLPTMIGAEVTLTEVAQLSALPVGTVLLVHNFETPLVLMDEDYI